MANHPVDQPAPTKARPLSSLAAETLKSWIAADGFGLAAALSFYTLFSLAPILVFGVLVSSHFLGSEEARMGAERWLEAFVSPDEATSLIGLVHLEALDGKGTWLTLITALMFFWAASLTFVRLRISVNRLMGYQADTMKQAVRNSLIGRLRAMAMTIGAGLLMAIGIWAVATLSGLGQFLGKSLDGWISLLIQGGAGLLIGAATVLVLMWLPLRRPGWQSVGLATVLVIILFELGRLLLNLYLGESQLFSAYGAASVLVVFLVWIYYSAQAFLLGATFCGRLEARRSS